jgi:DNA invertase Pin-like site-specific DNA recombinase
MTSAIGYCRVSTDQQGESGAGLQAQKRAIHLEVERRGWAFQTMYADIASGKSIRRRSDLATALEVMADGEADLLVVAKLDRLSRSLLDFADLMARAQREGWGIVALDIGVDTSTINGELVASIIMALAQWERRIIGQRTKDALGVVKDRGVVLGRPVMMDPATVTLMRLLRSNGRSYGAVAKMLNNEGVPTAQGGAKWYASTVRAALMRSHVA